MVRGVDGDFNPRAPCGARRQSGQRRRRIPQFQPTRPLRGATLNSQRSKRASSFQPTRPLRGATVEPIFGASPEYDFNPRAPCGARRCFIGCQSVIRYFNPRAPCGARLHALDDLLRVNISTHAPLAGRDDKRKREQRKADISTHAPLAGRDRSISLTKR